MEEFDVEKHWNNFTNDKLAVNCETEELAKEFLIYCHNKGMTWWGGNMNSLLEDNMWGNYEKDACYWGEKDKISISSLDYCKEIDVKTVKFQGFNADTYNYIQKPKPPLGVTPKDIYEFQRVQDLCRALYERSIYEEVDYELMYRWSEELNDRLFNLKISQE